jgi:hypothetical protein
VGIETNVEMVYRRPSGGAVADARALGTSARFDLTVVEVSDALLSLVSTGASSGGVWLGGASDPVASGHYLYGSLPPVGIVALDPDMPSIVIYRPVVLSLGELQFHPKEALQSSWVVSLVGMVDRVLDATFCYSVARDWETYPA